MVSQKTYWVDRFDHILSEEEYCAQDVISFSDVALYQGPKLEEYIVLENRLKAFLIDLTLSIDPNLSYTNIEALKKGEIKFHKNQHLKDWQLIILDHINQNSDTLIISYNLNLEKLGFYLELALREKINLKVYIKDITYNIGFDLKIFVKCDKELLSTLTAKHNLYILSEDCEPI